MKSITSPPWRSPSFLYTLYGQVSGNSSIVEIEPSSLVSWIATMSGLWHSKKATSPSFLPLMQLKFMFTNFSPLREVDLLIPGAEDALFMSTSTGSNLTVQSCTDYQKSIKIRISEVEKFTFWAYPGAVCIFQSFIFTVWNVRTFIMYPLCIHISHESHCLALWPFKTARLHRQLCNLRSTKYQLPIHVFFQMLYCEVLNMSHEIAFCSLLHSTTLYDALLYLYFLQSLHWNLGPGFISISPANINNTAKFVPCERLKVNNPSELLRFPSSRTLAKYWVKPLPQFLRDFIFVSAVSVQHTDFRGVARNFLKMKPTNRISEISADSISYKISCAPSVRLKKAWMFG